jgi:formate/nitrite transporter
MTALEEKAKKPGMDLFTPEQFVENYAAAGAKKAQMPLLKMLLLSILAGAFIALGALVANTATHTFTNAALAKTLSGLLFPFGLFMVVLTGSELFTGNCLMSISLLSKKAGLGGVLRNLVVVYIGNFIGAILIAALSAYFGQFELSGGQLAVYTIKIAAAKSALLFGNAFVLAIFCNLLVCIGVMCALSAKDVAGRAIGSFMPVCFFVIAGFEHCVANMYYIPAGLFAAGMDKYAALAVDAGLDTSALTWSNFFSANLLPVTLGNIVGGAGFGAIMWYAHAKKK